jgi:hypothetical protein
VCSELSLFTIPERESLMSPLVGGALAGGFMLMFQVKATDTRVRCCIAGVFEWYRSL